MVDQELQSLTKLTRKSLRPKVVDQSDVDHVPKVNSMFVSIGCQLHPHERVQRQNRSIIRSIARQVFYHRFVFVPELSGES